MIDIPEKYRHLHWKPVKDYEGQYLVSHSGLVASLNYRNTGRFSIMKQNPNKKGYLMVGFSKDCKQSTKKVHLLVASHFVPNPDNKPEVNHLDGIKINNFYKNLVWSTRKENIQHAHRTGLYEGSFEHMKIGVVGIEINGERTLIYQSQKQAETDGFDQTSISRCIRGIRKSHRGFRWLTTEKFKQKSKGNGKTEIRRQSVDRSQT